MKYFTIFPNDEINVVQFDDSHGTVAEFNACPNCGGFDYRLAKTRPVDVEQVPDDVLVNSVLYPFVSFSCLIVRRDFVDALRETQTLDQVELMPVRKNGKSLADFMICHPKFEIKCRGNHMALHALCFDCNRFWYHRISGDFILNDALSTDIAKDHATLIISERLLDRFSAEQRENLNIDPITETSQPLDNLTKQLSECPSSAWITEYFECRGNFPSDDQIRSEQMIRPMRDIFKEGAISI